MKRLLFSALAPSTVLLSTAAIAAIEVAPIIVIIAPADGQAEQTITVTNTAETVTYVTVQAREVMARGETDEMLRGDPNPANLGLLATPARLVLEPGERRIVRIVPIEAAGTGDRVWRVNISPATGRMVAETSGVAFQIGYDALIIQRAAEPMVEITGQREGRNFTLTNSGNSFAMIGNFRQCDAGDVCTDLNQTKRLYGGKSWTFVLPADGGRIEGVYEDLEGNAVPLVF